MGWAGDGSYKRQLKQSSAPLSPWWERIGDACLGMKGRHPLEGRVSLLDDK
jgi:hypothetical protein